jgi:predicted O-linked N-acetylglucosamine transferase (SPINDLY family)
MSKKKKKAKKGQKKTVQKTPPVTIENKSAAPVPENKKSEIINPAAENKPAEIPTPAPIITLPENKPVGIPNLGAINLVPESKPSGIPVPAQTSFDIDSTFGSAVQHHQNGRLAEAEALYRKILGAKPNHPDACHLLGLLEHQKGNYDAALNLIDNAIRIFSKNPMYHYNRGNVFIAQRKLPEAFECYKKAVELKPDYTEAYNNIGSALKDMGRAEEALEYYRKALEIVPNYLEATYNMGIVLAEVGKPAEAVEYYRKAIGLKPDHSEAYYNMGIALIDMGRAAEAITAYRKATEIRPDYVEAYNELGIELNAQGKTLESLDCYKKILEIRPECAEAYNNMGVALRNYGTPEKAIECYRKVLEIEPNNAVAHSNLLFSLQYTANHSPEWLFEEHRKWAEVHEKPLEGEILPHTNDRTPGRRLRVGYVSPDFRSHSCAYFLEPLIRAHDRNRVEIFCYSDVRREDDVTRRIRELADHWYSTVRKPHDVVANKIREDQIDILVDAAGHTAKHRLLAFSRKPAPIQINWLGYPDTTGMLTMDYRFTDFITDPEGLTDQYATETLVRLPGFLCYAPPVKTPDVAPLPALGTNIVTFGSFNNQTKVTEEVIDVWSKILHQVPRSRILLKSRQLANEATRNHYLEIFLKNGIPAGRITMLPRTPSQEAHLDMYKHVDIALDPFPYNGTTTSCEALWMGVPFITLCGTRHVARVGTSILTRAGLTEFIAETEEDYIAKAVQLANDINRLNTLRTNMRRQMQHSPLCDAASFARSVEVAYEKMWNLWCETGKRGTSPQLSVHADQLPSPRNQQPVPGIQHPATSNQQPPTSPKNSKQRCNITKPAI